MCPGHAGSERQKVTEGEGERLKEAGSINRSLASLGLVIKKLVEGSGPAAPASQAAHIPYRDSRLTFLLQVFSPQFTPPLALLLTTLCSTSHHLLCHYTSPPVALHTAPCSIVLFQVTLCCHLPTFIGLYVDSEMCTFRCFGRC